MKRRNFNKSILQQGGLMIEALAMLGLIAVVTPTMYKKSAERTMEVEDINTAATIRTINAAANDYVSANYATILGDMVKNNETNRKLELNDLKTYLPYGFNIEKALYNYNGNSIRISVARPAGSNNLTTLMLFPAKMDADNGIGQERTARIAALIGSSGGYVTDSHKARGIGGIWKLEGDDFTNNFGNADPNTYSIVTASADTISASAGNEMDYSKYLQRGKDAGDDEGQWKNTMRTDLYMGGPEGSSEDVYREATGPWSIRNINRLIVGTDYVGGNKEAEDATNYSLYVAPGAANPNAYIHGSLEAGNGQLNADENNLKYGTGTDDAGNSWVGFNVNREGTISNLKDLNLAQKFANGWNSIKIGALDDNDDDDTNYIIRAYHDTNNNTGHVSLLSDSIAQFHSYGSDVYNIDGDNVADNDDRIVFVDGGWKRLGTTNADELVEEPKYYNKPYFPMRIGSNVKADGLLAAGQIDTQKIRAASLSVGSHNIDDTEKWLNVDTYGITIKDVDRHYDGEDYVSTGTYGSFNNNGILLRVSDDKGDTRGITDEDKGTLGTSGGRDTSEHEIQFNLRTNKEFAGGTTLSNVAELFADNTDIRGKKIARISGQGTIIQAKSKIRDWKDDYDSSWEDETQDFKDTVGPNTLLLRNDDMQIRIHTVGHDSSRDNYAAVETVFEPRGISQDYTGQLSRTVFKNQSVNISNGNFRIARTQGGRSFDSVFSVRGNDYDDVEDLFDQKFNDCFVRRDSGSNSNKNINLEKKYWEPGGYDVAMHGDIVITPLYSQAPTANVSIGKFNKMAGINILTRKYMNEETIKPDNNYSADNNDSANYDRKRNTFGNIIMIDQGATDSDNNNRDHGSNTDYRVDPGTVYIRKGYVEVHGEKDIPSATTHSTKNAYEGNGVIVASRLVANNPTSGSYGATAPQLVTSNYKLNNEEEKNYNITVSRNNGTTTSNVETEINRYDTYMVNPAYTSVMHDIKLTTRGGARLSDILPDFINKGIYVVSNTISEQYNKEHTGEKGELKFNGYVKIVDDKTTSLPEGGGSKYSISSKEDINFSTERAWASPFLGTVPAPQCPPGYGRVITLSPYSFEMAQAGVLNKTKRFYDDPLSTNNASTGKTGIKNVAKDSYYVMPVNNANEVKSSLTPPEYAKTNVALDGNTDIEIKATNNNIGTINGTLDKLDGLSTQQYVLSSPTATDSSTTPVKPLFFQQSTRIKSATVPLVKGMETSLETEPSKLNGEYVQGWAAIIGFIYPAKMYSAFTGNDNSGFYWNLFPVMRGTINGYATVYCYFDRTNMYKRYNSNYSDYVDRQDYMKTMTGVPDSPQKTDSSYTKRLNDPNMKYNEVW